MKKYVSWEEVEQFIDKLEEQVKPIEGIQGVYGLPRGGLVLAVMVSHRLDIPLLMSPSHNCIIVDDICDSGESLIHYVNNTSGENRGSNYIATLYYKSNELNIVPDLYIWEKGDDWIVFPWEEKYD